MSINDMHCLCPDFQNTALPVPLSEEKEDFRMAALAFRVDPELKRVHQLNYGNRLIKSDNLPVPRFEIRWVRCENGSKDFGISYNFVLPYNTRTKNSLANKDGSDEMYLRISNEDIEVPLDGNGFSIDYVIRINDVGEMYLHAPNHFMDEALHDSELCNIPAYVVYKDYAMLVSKDQHKSVVSTPIQMNSRLPDTCILNNEDDVELFLDEMYFHNLNHEFSILTMKVLVEIALERTEDVFNKLSTFKNNLIKSFEKVFGWEMIARVLKACEELYVSLVDYFSENNFYILPNGVLEKYEFGGLHNKSMILTKKKGN